MGYPVIRRDVGPCRMNDDFGGRLETCSFEGGEVYGETQYGFFVWECPLCDATNMDRLIYEQNGESK